MNQPNFRTMLLGSRFTGPLIMAGCAYVTYRWWDGGSQGIAGYLAIGLCLASARAMKVMGDYRRWRAEWDGMSPDRPAKRASKPRPIVATLIIASVVVSVLFYAAQPDAPPEFRQTVAPVIFWWTGLGIAVTAIYHLWKNRSRRRREKAALVQVAIQKPVLRLTSLRECYQRLPPYCLRLLQRRS